MVVNVVFFLVLVSAEKRGGVLGGRGLRAVPGTGDVLLSGDRVVGLLDAAAAGGGRGHPQVSDRLSPRPLQGKVTGIRRRQKGGNLSSTGASLLFLLPSSALLAAECRVHGPMTSNCIGTRFSNWKKKGFLFLFSLFRSVAAGCGAVVLWRIWSLFRRCIARMYRCRRWHCFSMNFNRSPKGDSNAFGERGLRFPPS